MKNCIVLLLLWTIAINISCNSDDDTQKSEICDFLAELNSNKFNSTSDSNYSIENAEITEDCISIRIASGGCNGDSWQVELIGSESIDDSLPPIRSIILNLDNNEPCEALIHKTYTFEITPFQAGGEAVFLRLTGWDDRLLYEY